MLAVREFREDAVDDLRAVGGDGEGLHHRAEVAGHAAQLQLSVRSRRLGDEQPRALRTELGVPFPQPRLGVQGRGDVRVLAGLAPRRVVLQILRPGHDPRRQHDPAGLLRDRDASRSRPAERPAAGPRRRARAATTGPGFPSPLPSSPVLRGIGSARLAANSSEPSGRKAGDDSPAADRVSRNGAPPSLVDLPDRGDELLAVRREVLHPDDQPAAVQGQREAADPGDLHEFARSSNGLGSSAGRVASESVMWSVTPEQ